MRRSADNARGWYDDELTKQRRDWKEGAKRRALAVCHHAAMLLSGAGAGAALAGLDFGAVPDWALCDNDPANGNLDGFNRFPPAELLPDFRPTLVEYYEACNGLAARLTRLFAVGLGMPPDYFAPQLEAAAHTSYLRLNYYSPYTGDDPTQLCISPHKDAGFLTVLAQDGPRRGSDAPIASPRSLTR